MLSILQEKFGKLQDCMPFIIKRIRITVLTPKQLPVLHTIRIGDLNLFNVNDF